MKQNAENAFINRMWQLTFKSSSSWPEKCLEKDGLQINAFRNGRCYAF